MMNMAARGPIVASKVLLTSCSRRPGAGAHLMPDLTAAVRNKCEVRIDASHSVSSRDVDGECAATAFQRTPCQWRGPTKLARHSLEGEGVIRQQDCGAGAPGTTPKACHSPRWRIPWPLHVWAHAEKTPRMSSEADFVGGTCEADYHDRDGGIRTRDPLNPIQVRYRAALRPGSGQHPTIAAGHKPVRQPNLDRPSQQTAPRRPAVPVRTPPARTAPPRNTADRAAGSPPSGRAD
jgi:hypothetical protein